MENTSDVTPGSKTKSKEMTLTQAMSCLEVAMKWSSGFKKVTVGSEKNSECKEHVQDITVDTFTEEDLRGAMKSEIDTLGICSKFLGASKIQLFLCIIQSFCLFVLSGNFTKIKRHWQKE